MEVVSLITLAGILPCMRFVIISYFSKSCHKIYVNV